MSEDGSFANASLLLARRLFERHRGAPLLVSTVTGVVWEPDVHVPAGAPILELVAQSDGLLVISGLRCRITRPTAAAFFPAPFDDFAAEIVGAWITGALAHLPQPGTAVA